MAVPINITDYKDKSFVNVWCGAIGNHLIWSTTYNNRIQV